MARAMYLFAVALLLGCDSPSNTNKANSNSVETKHFLLSVLDDAGDTIAKDFLVRIKMPLDTTFMGPIPHVITYKQLVDIDSMIIQDYLFEIRNFSALHGIGEFSRLKHKIQKNGAQKFKVNYVQDLDWTKVNANQVNCIFEIWGIYGDEYLQAVTEANGAHKSLAEFHYHWKESNQSNKDFFKHANDSVFRKGYEPDQYFLTWGDSETEAFQITDEGIICDLNSDGIADRMLRYSKQGITGVCGVTRKERGGWLGFFDITALN